MTLDYDANFGRKDGKRDPKEKYKSISSNVVRGVFEQDPKIDSPEDMLDNHNALAAEILKRIRKIGVRNMSPNELAELYELADTSYDDVCDNNRSYHDGNHRGRNHGKDYPAFYSARSQYRHVLHVVGAELIARREIK